jgi:hypothetical protein
MMKLEKKQMDRKLFYYLSKFKNKNGFECIFPKIIRNGNSIF